VKEAGNGPDHGGGRVDGSGYQGAIGKFDAERAGSAATLWAFLVSLEAKSESIFFHSNRFPALFIRKLTQHVSIAVAFSRNLVMMLVKHASRSE